MIRRLSQASRATTVLATHNMPAAFSFSERFALMHGGRIVHHGDAESFRDCEDPIVHAFVYGPAPDGDGEMFRGDM